LAVIEFDHIAAGSEPNVALVRRTLAVLATAVALVAGAAPTAAQQGDAAPPPATPATVTGVADRVSQAASALARLEQQRDALAGHLAKADADIAGLQANLDDLQRTSSAAVAAARQQAVASYMRSDGARQTLALASAIAQDDVNDVAWSLGLLQVTHQRSLAVVSEATTANGSANQALTEALATRANLAAQAEPLGPAIDQARADLAAAQSELTTTIKRVGATVADGMTTVAYAAYRRAADGLAVENPGCGLRWELLSAIGKTESNHGGGRLDAKGDSVTPIIGIPIGADTDGGALDLDTARDHAVGPMQFIPSTWRGWGADGDDDGDADPNNIYDETLAAGRYLCRAAGPLTLLTREGVIRAILSYNPNTEYLRVVGARFEALASDVANGWFSGGDLPLPTPSGAPGENADGGHPPSEDAFAPPATVLRTLTVFSAEGVTVQTSGDVVAATCAAPSAVLGARTGFVRCTPSDTPATVLDPCVVSPSEPNLVACIADPQQPVRLLRATAPQVATAASPAPPYLSLVLSGGDTCLPVAPDGAPGPPTAPVQPAAFASFTALEPTTATGATTTTPATTTTSTTTSSTSTTVPATSTSTTSTTTATTAPATTTTTSPTSTTPPTPAAPGATYRCASGVSILGQPDASTPAWTVLIAQAGAPNRPVTVATAWA
jgi:hypothetical protein